MTPSLPSPAEAGAAIATFLGQAALPPVCLAVAWLALRGEPAPFLAILAMGAVTAGLSLPLLYRRGKPWPWPVLPCMAGAVLLLRIATGAAGVGEWLFLAALLALALGTARAARSAALGRFLASRRA